MIQEVKTLVQHKLRLKVTKLKHNDDLVVANTSSDRVGIQTTNPQATLDVEGDLRIGTDLEDNTGRVFKVYYANGDISWGE
jgi:hypothetical protein